jgi:molybdate transport system regulatory protein
MKKVKNAIIANARLYVSTETGIGVFGPGKAQLLAAVERLGSLRKAAAELGRSYRQAWGDVNAAEEHLGFPLVARTRGGIDGGTMKLTEQGRSFLRAWERHQQQVAHEVKMSFNKYIKPVIQHSSKEGS